MFSLSSFACEDSEFEKLFDNTIFNKKYRVYDKNPKVHGKANVTKLGLIKDNDYVVADREVVKDYIKLIYLDDNCQKQEAWTFKKALAKPLDQILVLSGQITVASQNSVDEPPRVESVEEIVEEPRAETSVSIDDDIVELSQLSGNLLDVAKDLCDYGDDEIRTENCLKVLRAIDEGELPKNPILYSLKTIKGLHGKVCRSRKVLNGCMVLVSDIDQIHKGSSYRHPAYFINLCVGDEKRTSLKDIYYKTYTNRGTGSKKDRQKASYTDLPFMKTTLPGIFVTGILRGFHPYHKSRPKYKKLLGYSTNDSRCEGEGNHKNQWLKGCPVLRLAVHRINGSLTESGKPMHTSPFSSSSGCPSVGQDDNWMIRHMASYRSTLYIAYTRTKKYRDYFKASNYCK